MVDMSLKDVTHICYSLLGYIVCLLQSLISFHCIYFSDIDFGFLVGKGQKAFAAIL